MRSSAMRLYWLALVLAVVAPAAAQKPVTAPPLTLAPLSWDMDIPHATRALEAAKLSPRTDIVRRYLAQPKGQARVEHTTEPFLIWSPRLNWNGFAHFVRRDRMQPYRIDWMSTGTEWLTPASLTEELAAIRKAYGEPQTKRANAWIWQQGGTTLTVEWSVDEKRKHAAIGMKFVLDPS